LFGIIQFTVFRRSGSLEVAIGGNGSLERAHLSFPVFCVSWFTSLYDKNTVLVWLNFLEVVFAFLLWCNIKVKVVLSWLLILLCFLLKRVLKSVAKGPTNMGVDVQSYGKVLCYGLKCVIGVCYQLCYHSHSRLHWLRYMVA
jgi:asparagine N-glycosylation enzyme membrane subunit Stt3